MKNLLLKFFLNRMNVSGKASPGTMRVQRVGPLGAFVLFILLAVVAAVGLAGFAVLSVGLVAYSVVRSFFPRASAKREAAGPKPAAVITVLDAAGNTVATVPRQA